LSMNVLIKISVVIVFCSNILNLHAQVKPLIYTYLGNEQRNYYGNRAPEKLDTLWKLYLGEGISPAYGNPNKVWKGAGWTGQPLYIREGDKNFLIQPSFDYNLKKINAETGEIVWQYAFDDILKGTPTFWENSKENDPEKRCVIMQGSRMGRFNSLDTEIVPSFRAISYMTGKELWRMNSKRTECSSRDVDGSAVVVNDTAYLALENGIFTVFSPDVKKAKKHDDVKYPLIYKEIQYFNAEDIGTHGNDVVSESSPTHLNNIIYTPSGSGHIYGHSISKNETVWDYNIGTDMNGSAPVTDDNCLIVSIEKQYKQGPGGVFKLDPTKSPALAVQWYFPVPDKKWLHWEGGIVGSVAVNDAYVSGDTVRIAAFTDVCGYFYIVKHQVIDKNRMAQAPEGALWFPTPELLFRDKVPSAISTPIIVEDKIIVPTDSGLFLYQIDYATERVTLLDSVPNLEIDATPIAVDGKIYVAVRDGYLYCFGKK